MTLRLGVVGLGMMGRHHARILQDLDGVEFVGAADHFGDRFGVVKHAPVFDSYQDLLSLGIDAVIVAVPTEHHHEVGMAVAESGAHALVEKPIAASSSEAREMVAAFEAKELILAIGHVERFNPALLELKRRLVAGDLGTVFSISTTRIGPFPDRIVDVGVIKDLGTHDLDIVRWIAGEDITKYAGFTSHQMGNVHEDLVSIAGQTPSGITINIQTNWVTPVKRRSVLVVGQKGAFEADMLTSDLTYYANNAIPTEWNVVAGIRGVSEGDVIRYALRKPEPLVSELTAFVSAINTGELEGFATALDGLAALLIAETILGDES